MKSFKRAGLYAAIGALTLGAAGTALAESNFQTNASGTITATARLDFQITIPRVLYLQVGTGGPFGTTTTTIDFITFSPSAANLGAGCGTPADCAGAGGNLTGGQVTASLISNVGTVKFSASTGGGSLNDGSGNTIPYVGQILVASTPTTGTLLTAPVFDAAAVSITPAAGSAINANATWKFTYANNTVYPSGVYGGQGTLAAGKNGGRVTYTATNP